MIVADVTTFCTSGSSPSLRQPYVMLLITAISSRGAQEDGAKAEDMDTA